MKLPTFLIIGAAKAGTTALYHYLFSHPQVYMSPVAETNFFALDGREAGVAAEPLGGAAGAASGLRIDTWDKFCGMFSGATHAAAVGEVSPAHLFVDGCAERIHHYLPKAKLIVILREPVERAYSHYTYNLRRGRESTPEFMEALGKEQRRAGAGAFGKWSYLQMGYYYAQLRRYYDVFDSRQIRVYLYEELLNDPDGLFEDLCTFIDVDHLPLPPGSGRRDVTRGLGRGLRSDVEWTPFGSRSPVGLDGARRLFDSPAARQKGGRLSRKQLDRQTRQLVGGMYAEDVTLLQVLIQRDLSSWASNTSVARA